MEKLSVHGKRKGLRKKQKSSKTRGLSEGRHVCWSDWLLGLALSALAAWLCYRSVFGLLSAVLILPVFHRMRDADRAERREQELMKQFCDALQSVSASLQTGSSIERAFLEAEKETGRLHGADSSFVHGLAGINRQVRMNEPLEEAFLKYAYQTGMADICSFAETFRYAKRSGADLPQMIRLTVDQIRERERILEDIRTMVTAKRLELRMLLLLVPGVLLFVTVSSPEYAQSLYHTLTGILLMSGCLAGYLAAAWWGRKIITIRV